MPIRAPKKAKASPRLNAEQKVAVSAGVGAWALIAGAGSGKSSVVLARYQRLVDEGEDPEGILTLTFTAEAARSLRARVEAMNPSGKRTGAFLTFHSLALSFAVAEREHFPFKLAEFPLATEAQAGKCVVEVARRFATDPRSLRSYISLQKRTRVSPAEAIRRAEKEGEGEKPALAYKAYEDKLRDLGVLDFDGLLTEMAALLEKNATIRARWQKKYLQCDEAQDNDPLNWLILRLLSEKHGNVYCVGDFAQSLYSFRGATPESFLLFAEMFPGAKTLYLAKNHRSTKKLVEHFQKVIANFFGSEEAAPVRELAERFHTDNELGVDPVIVKHASAFDEANMIVRHLKDGLVRDPDSCCVIARTNRALLPIESAFATAGIRYRNLGRSGFYAAPEVKAILAFLQCAVAPYDAAVLGALRSPLEPTRFLRKKEIADALTAEAKRTEHSVWKVLHDYTPRDMQQMRALSGFRNFLYGLTKYKNMKATDAVKGVLRDTRALDYYAEESADAESNPIENLNELQRLAGRFADLPALLEHVRKVQNAAKSRKGVCVSTVHQAKGLEWSDVYLVSAEEGILPHAKCEDVNEEARVFFVAVTRAAHRLTISYSGKPSRFLLPFIPKPEPDPFFDEPGGEQP